MTEIKRIAWSAAEFAEMTGFSEWQVRKLCRDGAIPATKFGQQWVVADGYVQKI